MKTVGDEMEAAEPDIPEGYTAIHNQNYYSVILGEDLGFTFITTAVWTPDELDSFMRASCDVVLQAHRHKLLIDALSTGSMVRAKNLLSYHSGSKAEDFIADTSEGADEPRGYS